jgi:hypothetical protein
MPAHNSNGNGWHGMQTVCMHSAWLMQVFQAKLVAAPVMGLGCREFYHPRAQALGLPATIWNGLAGALSLSLLLPFLPSTRMHAHSQAAQ